MFIGNSCNTLIPIFQFYIELSQVNLIKAQKSPKTLKPTRYLFAYQRS